MRRTLTNVLMLLAVPVTMLPIVLGASTALERQRKDLWFQMRREHLRSLARDRRRAAERRVRKVSDGAGKPSNHMAARPPAPPRQTAR